MHFRNTLVEIEFKDMRILDWENSEVTPIQNLPVNRGVIGEPFEFCVSKVKLCHDNDRNDEESLSSFSRPKNNLSQWA